MDAKGAGRREQVPKKQRPRHEGFKFQGKTLARLTQTGMSFSWTWQALIRGSNRRKILKPLPGSCLVPPCTIVKGLLGVTAYTPNLVNNNTDA